MNKAITVKKFIDFWNEKIKFIRCGLCSKHDCWLPLESATDENHMAILASKVMEEDDKAHFYYQFVCSNCGNSHQLLSYVVDQWVKENG